MACPICSERCVLTFSRNYHPKMLICSACRHLFWEVTPSEDELNEYYVRVYTDAHNQLKIQTENIEYYRSHLRELLALLQARAEDTTMADFGSSYPLLLIEARKAGFKRVMGIDPDPKAQDYGERNGVQMLSLPDFFDSVPDSSLDLVRFSHALEHIRDPLSVVMRARTRLRSGGLMYITQPNIPVFAARCCDIYIDDAVYPEHLHFFSPISLKRMLACAGLTALTIYTHTQEAETIEKYRDHIDQCYAESEMYEMQDKGKPAFGAYANFPHYGGRNSVVHAYAP